MSSSSSGPSSGPFDPSIGALLELAPGLVVGRLDLRLGGPQVIGGVVFRGPGEERVQPPLEGVVLVDVVGVPDSGRVHGRVEHHPAHPVGEQRPVDLAEIGAVGDPVVADLRHPERLADLVHVAGHVDRRHVGQHPAETLLAPGRVGLGPADQHLLGGRAGGDVVGPHLIEETGVAAERGHRPADPARVEPDDVIGGRHLRAQPGRDLGRERPAGLPRSPRVDQQHALLPGGRGGGRHHRQRQRDLPAAGVGVVQRHRERRALQARQLPAALAPVQRRRRGHHRRRPGAVAAGRAGPGRGGGRSGPGRGGGRAGRAGCRAGRAGAQAHAHRHRDRRQRERRPRGDRSLGEGEIGMPSILPHRPTASDTDRHRFDTEAT